MRAPDQNSGLSAVGTGNRFWLKKSKLFSAQMDSPSGSFTFDPKCFYDHLADRFVIVALEVYGSTQAWITVGVSDDGDPNGVWYKYRESVKTTINGSDYWVDYPGVTNNLDVFVVNGNLFDFAGHLFGGTKYRVIVKSSILGGGTSTTWPPSWSAWPATRGRERRPPATSSCSSSMVIFRRSPRCQTGSSASTARPRRTGWRWRSASTGWCRTGTGSSRAIS